MNATLVLAGLALGAAYGTDAGQAPARRLGTAAEVLGYRTAGAALSVTASLALFHALHDRIAVPCQA